VTGLRHASQSCFTSRAFRLCFLWSSYSFIIVSCIICLSVTFNSNSLQLHLLGNFSGQLFVKLVVSENDKCLETMYTRKCEAIIVKFIAVH
jgi:hypothetical protein